MKIFLCLCLWLTLSFLCKGQERYAISITDKESWLSNNVYNVFEDRQGYIWITGNVGLLKFDATNYIPYRCNEQSSLAGSCINQDKYGRIWYENFDGYLFYVVNNVMKPLKQKNVFDFIPFGFLKNHLIKVHKKSLDIYDLKTLKKIYTNNTSSPAIYSPLDCTNVL